MSFPILGSPKPQFFDSSGNLLSGGFLHVYEPADDTEKNTYPTADDADATTNANTNPVVLNARGEPAVGLFGVDGEDYKLVLRDSGGTTIWTTDDIFLPWVDPEEATYTPAGVGAEARTIQSKLDEFVSVTDFGVTGDGTTDDTTNFVEAITAYNRVFVPDGTYILDNAVLPADTHIVASPAAIFKLLSTSSTKVLLNSSNNNIVIEGGQFDNNEVVNSVAVQFTGTGLKVLGGRFLGGTGAQIAISLNSTASEVEIAQNDFIDCRFCVLTGGTTSATTDVWVHHNYAKDTTGDFVEINCPSGTARRWIVEHNIVDTVGRDNNGTGFGVGASGGTGCIDGLTIAYNHFRDVDNQSVHIEDGAKNVDIIGNQIYGNGANSTATITNPCAIYVAATVASNRQISGVTISNNRIMGLGDMNRGIFFGGNYDITNVVVDGNTVDNFDDFGIHLSSLITQGNVYGNTVRNGTGSASGFRVDGTNVILAMNRSSDNAGYGLDIIGGTNIQFVKNQLKNNTSGRVQNMANGTNMDWSLQGEMVSSNRTISGTVNDLDPLDELVVTVTTADTTPQLTGILAKPGGLITVYNNTGAASFDLMHEDSGSAAANRFVMDAGADITLVTGKLRRFQYIGSRWREI